MARDFEKLQEKGIEIAKKSPWLKLEQEDVVKLILFFEDCEEEWDEEGIIRRITQTVGRAYHAGLAEGMRQGKRRQSIKLIDKG